MSEKITSVDILLENYFGLYNVFSGNKLKCNYNFTNRNFKTNWYYTYKHY